MEMEIWQNIKEKYKICEAISSKIKQIVLPHFSFRTGAYLRDK
jgi:hypothetical protein